MRHYVYLSYRQHLWWMTCSKCNGIQTWKKQIQHGVGFVLPCYTLTRPHSQRIFSLLPLERPLLAGHRLFPWKQKPEFSPLFGSIPSLNCTFALLFLSLAKVFQGFLLGWLPGMGCLKFSCCFWTIPHVIISTKNYSNCSGWKRKRGADIHNVQLSSGLRRWPGAWSCDACISYHLQVCRACPCVFDCHSNDVRLAEPEMSYLFYRGGDRGLQRMTSCFGLKTVHLKFA